MTIHSKTVAQPFTTSRSSDTSVTNSAQQAKSGAGTLVLVDIDNTNNGAITYVKMWDATSITVGTTSPDWIFMVPPSIRRVFSIPKGLTFGTGLGYAAVTTGGTAGTTNPSSAVALRLAFT